MSCCNLSHCMFVGFCCEHAGFDCDNTVFCCVQEGEFLCLRSSGCLAAGVPDKGVGMVTQEDEICKLGLYCCNIGLLVPQTLCKGASQMLCCYSVSSLPCHEDYVPGCVCAYYGLQCAPKCGCCAEPGPRPAALERLVKGEAAPAKEQEMER